MEVDTAVARAAERLGLRALKQKQTESIKAFLSGNDVFVTVPTGYGKSIVYGILPFAFDFMKGTSDSILVCISPLTSIMLDQTEKFSAKGLSVGYVGEGQLDPSVAEKVLKGKYQLVLLSPENIVNDTPFRHMLLSAPYQKRIVGLAIDEAHCVQSWGNKFRISFSRLGELRSLLPNGINILALTATATMDTLEAVKHRLSMPNPIVIGLSPHRENIFYSVQPYLDVFQLRDCLLEHITQHYPDVPKVVIFCQLDDGSKLNKILNVKLRQHYKNDPIGYLLVDMFNKACSIKKRTEIIESFCKQDSALRIVIASTSFGLGVDCPDIRKIIHWGPPESLDIYMQETGRAGRDGMRSDATLLYGHARQYVSDAMKKYGQNTSVCRRELLYKSFLFSDTYNRDGARRCLCCDICFSICECELCTKA